ncbi:DNA annealing helicase and endonuclease ZRANB3 [Raphanus sativus]|nr:DNA annealing helicase and endonuclease ZRANB3 [Raphanus sativus]
MDEANRFMLGEKRKPSSDDDSSENPHRLPHDFRLSKCRKLDGENDVVYRSRESDPGLTASIPPEKFRARLEICSPDSFTVTPVQAKGFRFPEKQDCLRQLNEILSDAMPSHYTQNQDGGKAGVYKIRDYSTVLGSLRRSKTVEVEEIPWITFAVVEKLSRSFVSGRWEPCTHEHFSEEKVEEMIRNLPRKLVDSLLPFQLDGLRFGLRRGGRCLIADEMGLGKTLQAISIAGCFMNEGSILVVCPAVLRYSWAEELERWLPFCLPSDIHLVFGHQNNPAYLPRWPKVVVISYTMLQRLRKTMLEREWALLILDESHHVRCSKKNSESSEIQTVLDVAEKVKHIVLLSGTPSLSRPGLLGKNKYEFAKTYCEVGLVKGIQGKIFQDFSKGTRLLELNVLLNQTVMIRRLKQHVLTQLPPKRRQIVTILLKKSDIALAMTILSEANKPNAAITDVTENTHEPKGIAQMAHVSNKDGDVNEVDSDDPDCEKDNQLSGNLTYQQLGVAKLSAVREWLSLHPLISGGLDYTPEEINEDTSSNKMVIFAHHHKVLDGVQEFMCDKGIGFVRIDGTTLPRDRQLAVQSFQFSSEVKVAIIGVEAGGVGLDFSAAQNVVFVELPKTPSLLLQAEDRAHRRGQTSAVNVYIFCAKDTMDESNWQNLNKKLHRISSTTDGKYDAKTEIEIERAHLFKPAEESIEREAPDAQPSQTNRLIADNNVESCEDLGSETDVSNTIDLKDNMISHLDILKIFCPSVENGSGSKKRSPGTISSTILDREKQENHQPENFIADNGLLKENESSSFFPLVDSLRFEVSQNTGRIHLYTCIPGKDPRPRPHFQNFRPEEIEASNSTPCINKDNTSESLTDDPVHVRAILEFMKEWKALRPIEKRKLLGKPLQLPLSLELSYLSERTSHNSEGLLRGGSKRRNTPFSEISVPLPQNSVWKKVNLRSGYQRKEKEYTQAWSMSNEPLCKFCQKPCKGSNAKEPEYFEDLFCDLECYEDYRTRTSSRYIRQELFQIEHGVCTNCNLDCHQLVRYIKPLPLEKRREYINKVAPVLFSRKNLLETLVNDPAEGNAWHADHIIPVYRGGGECRLENMRTLCVACHADVTAAQCAERKIIRSKARKQLKATLKELRNIPKKTKLSANDNKTETDCSVSVIEEEEDDELLVEVPGSSYSIDQKINPDS